VREIGSDEFMDKLDRTIRIMTKYNDSTFFRKKAFYGKVFYGTGVSLKSSGQQPFFLLPFRARASGHQLLAAQESGRTERRTKNSAYVPLVTNNPADCADGDGLTILSGTKP
jgi:hypothetical protein